MGVEQCKRMLGNLESRVAILESVLRVPSPAPAVAAAPAVVAAPSVALAPVMRPVALPPATPLMQLFQGLLSAAGAELTPLIGAIGQAMAAGQGVPAAAAPAAPAAAVPITAAELDWMRAEGVNPGELLPGAHQTSAVPPGYPAGFAPEPVVAPMAVPPPPVPVVVGPPRVVLQSPPAAAAAR